MESAIIFIAGFFVGALMLGFFSAFYLLSVEDIIVRHITGLQKRVGWIEMKTISNQSCKEGEL